MTEEKKEATKKAAPKKTRSAKKPSAAEKKAIAAAEEATQRLEQQQAEFEEMKKDLLYQRAELENFKRRTKERFDESVRYAAEKVVIDLLPVLDNLERAMEHSTEGEAATDALAEGVGHTIAQFRQTLESHGVEVIEALGETFDPNFHEALAQMPGETDNIVMMVHEKGYKLNGKLLRPARVVVSKLATQ
jgi:molecular chaperone GrpE